MKLSIIIPVYNSANILDKLVQKIEIELKDKIDLFELFLINDFSQDDSWQIIKELALKYDFIKGISLENNFGQHNAIMAGLNECIGEYIVLMDDDLQHDPEYILNIYNELINNFDVCYVNYLNRKHKNWKRFVSWLNNLISSILMNKPIRIYTSSFKGIKKNIVEKMILFKERDIFLDWLIFHNTKKVTIIDVKHRERYKGSTTYGVKKLFALWSSMIITLPLKTRLITFIPIIILKIIIKIFYYFFSNNKSPKQYIISEKTY
jgi:polyisoprenyl-phosphate glycosyltransferase